MKKIIITLFAISYFFVFINYSKAFLINDEKGFYSGIADNINKMENNLFSIDLIGENGTKSEINRISGIDCLSEDLSESEIRNIVGGGNIEIIINKLDSSCFDSNGNLEQSLLMRVNSAIVEVYNKNLEISREKSRQLINLGSNNIYSDGIEENSPFDLIIDLLNIDSIIFMEQSSVYEGNTNINLWDKLDSILRNVDQINRNIELGNNLNNLSSRTNSNNSVPFYLNSINSQNIYGQNICPVENSNLSGLNQNQIENLLGNLGDTYVNGVPVGGLGNTNNQSNNIEDIKNKISDYTKVTDNSVFPCNNIFCITIDFITYNHNLLGGGYQNVTIEYLLNRSNEHLRKFAGTSLIPAKMTINNFELGLKDLNLPNLFHMGFQITTKPVPILELEPEGKVDEGIYATNNLLKSYYQSYGLDYNRRNDLSLLNQIEADKQIALNSSMLNNEMFLNNIRGFDEHINRIGNQREIITKMIENNSKNEVINNFEKQFKELEIFNKSINDYVNNLDAIIKNMKKIPIDSGVY